MNISCDSTNAEGRRIKNCIQIIQLIVSYLKNFFSSRNETKKKLSVNSSVCSTCVTGMHEENKQKERRKNVNFGKHSPHSILYIAFVVINVVNL